MRLILITFVYVLLGSLVVQCSEIHVKDEQSWYEDDSSARNTTNQNNNLGKDSSNPTYQKLLSVERQILMSEQMIKLYRQRLSVLKELKKQLQNNIANQKNHIQAQQSSSKPSDSHQDVKSQKDKALESSKPQTEQNKHKKQPNQYRRNPQSTAYVFLKQYSVDVSGSQENSLVDDSIVLLPPFVINKAKSQVSIFGSYKNFDQTPQYSFGQTSNRLLFYSLEKSLQEINNQNDEDELERGAHFTLNLALQIKPNKIKSVKIHYRQKSLSNHSATANNFNIQETITSYESNELISQDFKWHKALQFENQIIGFYNQKVYIKGKQKKMNEVDIGSKVLGVYSLNQYKLLYVAENKVGTINVRSFIKADEIRFEYYLGNKTLIKQKELQKRSDQENEQVQDDYSHESFDPGSYWDSPFTKKFSKLRAVSVYYLQATKQVLILLSNGQLLLHSNQKFIASTNFETQLMKTLNFQHLFAHHQSKALQNIKIKMELLPSFKHILVSSNFCNKLLIFNVTIPYLTQVAKSQGILFFSSSTRSNGLTAKHWRNLQISGQQQRQNFKNVLRPKDSQIYLFITSPVTKQRVPQVMKRASDLDEQVVYFYHCQHSYQNLNSGVKSSEKNSDLIHQITISEYRLLLNLFDQNSLGLATSQPSQGRSFWWNILLVAMIGIGVFVIRKCKQGSSQPKQQWEDSSSQKLLKPKSGSYASNNLSIGKNNPKMTKQQDKHEKKPTTKTKIEYDNMVISQLQNYLEKQGQKLSKQEIAFMVRQMQQNQQNQTKKKPQMKRQQKVEQAQTKDAILLKNTSQKNVQEKQRKKPNGQEKSKQQKTDQKSRRKNNANQAKQPKRTILYD